MKKVKLLYCIFLSLLFNSSLYAVTLDVREGVLFGASDVNVNGVLYDVAFMDGSCIDLFNGCDQNSDFTFSSPDNDGILARLASTALLEQVFLDSSLGAFDSTPNLTDGCTHSTTCNIFTPIITNGSVSGAGLTSIITSNRNLFDVPAILDGRSILFDSTLPSNIRPDLDAAVYAVWSPGTVVPIPGSLILFVSGFLGLIGVSKRRKYALKIA